MASKVEFDITGSLSERGKRAFADTAEGAEKAGRKVDDLDHSLAGLDDEIKRLAESTTRLKKELGETGDRGVLRELTRDQSTLRRLQAVRSEFDKIVEKTEVVGRKSVSGFVGGLTDTLGTIPTKLRGALIAGAVAGGTAMAPLIISAVAGAAVTAAVAGAVGSGVALAFRDTSVRAAAEGLADDVKTDMLAVGQAFVQPTLAGIDQIRDEWRSTIGPELGAALRAATQFVEPLARAATRFAEPIVAGFRYMVERGQPVVDMLRQDLPGLGEELAGLMRAFGDNADSGARALHDIVTLTEMAIDGWANLTDAAGAVYDTWSRLEPLLGGVTQALFRIFQAQEEAAVNARWVDPQAESMRRLADETAKAAADLRAFNQATDEAIGKTLSLDQATLAFNEGLLAMKDGLTGGKRSLDEHTKAGQANRDILLDMISKADAVRQAAIRMGDGSKAASDKANAAFLAQLEAMRRMAVAAGLPLGPLNAIFEAYMRIVRAPNPTKTIHIRILTEGRMPGPGAGIVGFSAGGPVRGGIPGVDSVPIMAKPREYVLREDMVQQLGGVDYLESLRRGTARPRTAAPTSTSAPSSGWAGPDPTVVARVLAAEVRRALAGLTLVVDDRSGTRAHLIARAG